MMNSQVVLSHVRKISADGSIKCLSVKPDSNMAVEYLNCPETKEDPYFIFKVIRKNGQVTILSTYAGKCIGVDIQGKAVYNIGCDVQDSALMEINNELYDPSGKNCIVNSSGTHCDKFIFEDINKDTRIWWNVDEIYKGYKNSKNPSQEIQNELNKNSLIKINYPTLKFDTKGWQFDVKNDYITEYLAYILKNKSVIGENNKLVAWSKYSVRFRKPKCYIIFGSSGIGKTKVVEKYAGECYKPILISYDVAVENLPEFWALTHLEGLGLPDVASDPTAYRTFYEVAGKVEESIKAKLLKNKLDFITEKADIPKLKQITDYTDQGYEVGVVYVRGSPSVRKTNMVKRFKQTGRLGKYFEEIDEEKVKTLFSDLKPYGVSCEVVEASSFWNVLFL